MKNLLKNNSIKYLFVSKDNISQSLDILIDIVKICAKKYSSNCVFKIKGYILCAQIPCVSVPLCEREKYLCLKVYVTTDGIFISKLMLKYMYKYILCKHKNICSLNQRFWNKMYFSKNVKFLIKRNKRKFWIDNGIN